MRVKKIALCALLCALALALAVLERTVPLGLLIPLPGVKLGLANTVTLIALLRLDLKSAFAILLCRIVLAFLLFSSLTSFLMSLCGGMAALTAMAAARPLYGRSLSVFGLSILGAALHNAGQVACACLLLKSLYAFYYLPPLLFASVVTGGLTALAASGVLKTVK